MLTIDLIVAGKLGKGFIHDGIEEYKHRLKWKLNIYEFESKAKKPDQVQREEEKIFLERLDPRAFKVIMDERGKTIKSLDFASLIQNQADSGQSHLQFLIGGADGLTQPVRDQANLLLSFGKQTWPHMLARLMLLEQIYRAQQIMNGHPYHRE